MFGIDEAVSLARVSTHVKLLVVHGALHVRKKQLLLKRRMRANNSFLCMSDTRNANELSPVNIHLAAAHKSDRLALTA